MALVGLRYVAPVLRVASVAKATAFYQEKLGFEREFEHAGTYASLRHGASRIHLAQGGRFGRDQAAFEREEQIDACILVDDAAALAKRVGEAGATISVPLRRMPYGVEFYVRDPDGNVLGFVQPSP
jgi:predicted enzyme related to lactoylglutathione lyase